MTVKNYRMNTSSRDRNLRDQAKKELELYLDEDMWKRLQALSRISAEIRGDIGPY